MSNGTANDGLASLVAIARSWQSNPTKIKRFLSRYEYNEADVQDIIQDALTEAVRCIGKFRGESSLETWLFGIAINVARHHVVSSLSRGKWTCSLDDLLERTPETVHHACRSSDSLDPARQMQAIQFAENLAGRVSHMPTPLQQTFELLFVHDYSYVEAAAELSIPVGTVRSRAHRVRQLLNPPLM
jgi:RNA polymerase sigma factor (sigma-70 family)